MKSLIFASGNPHKVEEAAAVLGDAFRIITPAEAGLSGEIPETGNTLRSNSLQKARYIYEHTGADCFADDTGLEVDILGGEPGVFTARYAGEACNPEANMQKLLLEMSRREYAASAAREAGLSTPYATRRARFRTCVTLILDGQPHYFDGILEGQIAREKSGVRGFGYDPVFIPDDYPDRTLAELPPEVKNAISHRGKAVRAMAEYLKGLK